MKLGALSEERFIANDKVIFKTPSKIVASWLYTTESVWKLIGPTSLTSG